jgi:predicted nuclease of predicted toxin-antitoxin system
MKGIQRCQLMRILFDHGVPAPLLRFLSGHAVEKAKDRGWDTLGNGDLLAAAEAAGFELIVTADKNIRYQQRLEGRRIAILVLGNPQWPVVRRHVQKVAAAVNAVVPGSYIEVEIP